MTVTVGDSVAAQTQRWTSSIHEIPHVPLVEVVCLTVTHTCSKSMKYVSSNQCFLAPPALGTWIPLYAWRASLFSARDVLNRALESCEAVSIALRSSTVRASLGMTVYVAVAAGHDGALEAVRVVEEALDQGRIADATSASRKTVAREKANDGSVKADDVDEGDQVEEEQEKEQVDQVGTYLVMYPNSPSDLKPNITLVIVEALPRG